ncbi:hypothetical protein AB1P65_21165 [Roseibium alexandrii]
MPDNQNRTTENEFAEIVLTILLTAPNGQMLYSELIEEIPNHLVLTSEDQVQSDTRDQEQVWEQRVRNITSHQKASTNYINLGYLEPIESGLKITALGRQRLQN